jgi:hypothetical protein
MFVYLLITAELALVYTAFWYLYLRDPKDRENIQAALWGTYEESMDVYGPPLAQEFVLDRVKNNLVPISETGSVLVQMARSVDRTFSQLNVRP